MWRWRGATAQREGGDAGRDSKDIGLVTEKRKRDARAAWRRGGERRYISLTTPTEDSAHLLARERASLSVPLERDEADVFPDCEESR